MTAIKKLLAWLKGIYYKPHTGDVTVAKSISITADATATVGDILEVTAKVEDESGQPVSGGIVIFSFASGAIVSGADGSAKSSYHADDVGVQVITATVDSQTASAVINVKPLQLAEAAPITTVDSPEVATEVVPAATTETGSLAEFKAKAEAFFALVEHGVEVLGKDAEADLVALRSKYL